MEYLEGETLEQRLKKGALPLDQALQIAIQIADALAAAHRAGIVHRDLKPGNVMLTKVGREAARFRPGEDQSLRRVAGSLSMLPTTPPNLTAQGTILGTFQYMAPEQLEGQEADARTDIFAFGAVLYEMVTGKQAFEGKSQASLIGAILKDEPPPISTLQPLSPLLLERIVGKCLAKEPDARWQSAADLRDELQWVAHVSPPSTKAEVARAAEIELRGRLQVYRSSSRRWRWPPGSTELACQARPAALKCALKSACRGDSKTGWRFRPTDARSSQVDWLTGNGSSGCARLDSLIARPLEGTEGAIYPFWSPDSKSIGFFAEGKLKRIDIAGGPAQTLANAREPRGGAWGPDGTIIFTPALYGGLYRVSATGGEATPQTHLAAGTTVSPFSVFSPRRTPFPFFHNDCGRIRRLVGRVRAKASDAQFRFGGDLCTAPGVLLFMRQRTLMAQPFSVETLQTTGNPLQVAEVVAWTGATNTGTLPVSAATDGTIAFHAASGRSKRRVAVGLVRPLGQGSRRGCRRRSRLPARR